MLMTNRSLFKNYTIFNLLIALTMALSAIYLFLSDSKDGLFYQEAFGELNDDIYYSARDFLFWGGLYLFKLLGFGFAISLVPILCLSLSLKLNALSFFGNGFLFVVLGYSAIFFLLHESCQLRIAIGLSFALSACQAIVMRRVLMSLLMVILGAGFHSMSVLLPVVFCLSWSSIKIRKFSWFFLFAGIAFFLNGQLFGVYTITELLDLGLLDEHYRGYIEHSRLQTQDSSGLMIPYAFALTCVLIIICMWLKRNKQYSTALLECCLAVCVFGNGILFLMYDAVAFASRISDVLIILIIPLISVIANRVSFLYQLIIVLAFVMIFCARYYQLYLM